MSELRMNAYYFGFAETGCRVVDEILSAVACAGKGYHHTEEWSGNECDDLRLSFPTKGKSYVLVIQDAASVAANRIAALEQENAQLRAENQEYALNDTILRKAYEDSGLSGKFTWHGWLLEVLRENTKLKQPVSEEEKIHGIALAAAKEVAESFNISMPRGMSYSNGILHTIRIIIETHLRGESRESLLAARSQTEGGK
jgi:hypothetical protein